MEELEPKKDSKSKKIGLSLKIKVSNNTIGNYDKFHIENCQDAIITKKTLLIVNKNNRILKLNNQEEAIRKEGEHILFSIRKRKDFFQLEKELCDNMILSKDNIEGLNYNLWYVINNDNVNDDYYLNENDIIRFGDTKLVLTKIHINDYKGYDGDSDKMKYNVKEINSNEKDKKIIFEQIFDDDILSNNNLDYCNICNSNIKTELNPLIKLCDCSNYKHYKCIQEDIKNNKKTEKHKKNFYNYYFKSYCYECEKSLPLKFKIKGKEKEEDYELFKFDVVSDSEDYLMFQSLDYLDRNQDYQKSVHIIKLSGEDNIINIKIGRDGNIIDNDIKLVTESTSREHAFIEYNREKKYLLLKNKSKKNDSLVLIKNILKINKNIINLQIGKVSVEAKLIEEDEFKGKENIIDKIQTKDEYKDEIRKEIESCKEINDNWYKDIKTETFFKYSEKK